MHHYVFGENCTEKICFDCEFRNTENIENWLNAEHVEPEPPLLENGDGLKPGDWIMVSVFGTDYVKRQFLFFNNGNFYTTVNDEIFRHSGNYTGWKYARLPMDGE